MAFTVTKRDDRNQEKTINGIKQYFKGVLSLGDTDGSTTQKWALNPIVKVTPCATSANGTVLWNSSTGVITFTGWGANDTLYFSVEGNEIC